jgi:hypothetical protein
VALVLSGLLPNQGEQIFISQSKHSNLLFKSKSRSDSAIPQSVSGSVSLFSGSELPIRMVDLRQIRESSHDLKAITTDLRHFQNIRMLDSLHRIHDILFLHFLGPSLMAYLIDEVILNREGRNALLA